MPKGGKPNRTDTPSTPEFDSSRGVSRRGFLQGSVIGTKAAAAAAGAGVGAAMIAGAAAPQVRGPRGRVRGSGRKNRKAAYAVPAGSQPIPDPAAACDTWNEPWVWRPHDFPGEEVQFNVVEHQSPSIAVGFGNPNASLFTYNGFAPGPTIRMKGDQTLRLKLFNQLGLNDGRSPVGPAPDLNEIPPDPNNPSSEPAYPSGVVLLEDWCLGEHTNGVHSAHTTNLHTHGLHVRPGRNPDDSHSDNIFVRVMPNADYRRRQEEKHQCRFLRDLEQVGQADYEFHLGHNGPNHDQPHAPGTHWYHPHPHGATHNEVASGMAGYLIVEGDVDEALNTALTGEADPDPAAKTGKYDYRERLMFVQRLGGEQSADPDALAKRLQRPPADLINGTPAPPTMRMRPGAVERWRFLNGSVDGKGYTRFMVLKGQWVNETPPDYLKITNRAPQLLRVDAEGRRHFPTTAEVENAKQQLYQLSMDGVTLVRATGDGKGQYYIKDLNFRANPNPANEHFDNLGECFRNAESIKACFVRPNELYVAPANRADLLFQAPRVSDASGQEVYTILTKGSAVHTENVEQAFQLAEADGTLNNVPLPPNTIIAYLVVGQPDQTDCETEVKQIPAFDVLSLNEALAKIPLPSYLAPVRDEEIEITRDDEKQARKLSGSQKSYRTRRVDYSGWGSANWPFFRTRDLVKFDRNGPSPGKIDPVYLAKAQYGGKSVEIVLPPSLRTMAIDGRKFDPTDETTPRILVDTAEEWVVYNNSITLFGPFPPKRQGESDAVYDYQRRHTVGYPATRAEANRRGWKITTRGIDHPFHIHINPFWVTRLEVPDENGNLVNIIDEPRWQDVVWIPRNAGRVVFRSRFTDYVGEMVNHCHILLHEDNGMMQSNTITADPRKANYTVGKKLVDSKMPAQECSEANPHYQPVSLEQAYVECTHFLDPNQNPHRYQEFPTKNGAFRPPRPPR